MSSVSIENLDKTFGNVRALADVSLDVRQGEMLVLVGPSGCGKTTCLRCLAGLERPTGGRIRIGERVVTAINDGIFVPPEKREIGMVFQSYAVWPHMTVFENVAYPLRALGVKRADIEKRVREALRLVQLEALGDRYSSQISGGQQQRVALARSLVAEPSLLLFDEPLSNLDANLRLQMRVEIKELQRRLRFTGVYVTHDQAEALAIADRVAIMQGGVLRQIGSPRDVYDRPANTFVAGFMGSTNLLPGVVTGRSPDLTTIRLSNGAEVRASGGCPAAIGQNVHVSIRPETMDIAKERPAHETNVWPVSVALSTFVGEKVIYHVSMGPLRLEVHTRPNQIFEIGESAFAVAAPSECIMLSE